MFDARHGNDKSGGGLAFGLITIGVVSALFIGVLFFPSITGEGKAPVPGLAEEQADPSLLTAFEDTPTQVYLTKLQRTFPSVANDLQRDVNKARSRGADNVELGVLVMQAGYTEIEDSFERLARADVRYFNEMLDLGINGLTDLSRSGAPYCKGSDLITLASLSEQQLYAAAFDRVGHGAGLYNFGLEFNGIVLDAIHDARANPRNYGPLTPDDQRAVQTLMLGLVTDPQIMKLMTLEGSSRAEMDRAMEQVNFCDLGATILRKIDALPQDTKGRLWSEVMSQAAHGGIERQMRQLSRF
jgi:hypothetical protein